MMEHDVDAFMKGGVVSVVGSRGECMWRAGDWNTWMQYLKRIYDI